MKRMFVLMTALSFTGTANADNWPAFRGAVGDGVAAETKLPTEWSKTKNIVWKTPLPEKGNSSPIVWGDRVFITQAIEKENKRLLLCIDRADGKILWRKGVTHAANEPTHSTNPYCSATPATDGSVVVASFGSAGAA